MANQDILKNIYLFKNMNTAQLGLISGIVEFKSFKANEDIFVQGSSAENIFIVSYGSVRIHQKNTTDENIEIAILGPGSHFGEMALLDNEVRSASATAMENTDLAVINYDKLKEVLNSDISVASQFYKEISFFLVNRLRITTLDLSYSRERYLSHF